MEHPPATAGHPGQRRPAGRPGAAVAAVVAAGLQIALLGLVLVMGLGWGGWSHVLALLQGVVGLLVISRLARSRRLVVLAVPFVSAALALLLLALGTGVSALTECSRAERDAVAQLAQPEGSVVELEGSMGQGCRADFTTDLSAEELGAHYGREFEAHGWEARPVGGGDVAAARKGDVLVVVERLQEVPQDQPRVLLSVADDVPDR